MGGKRIDREGSFIEATILSDIKPDNPAFREEFSELLISVNEKMYTGSDCKNGSAILNVA